ncbi:MAG: ABC transporter permease [Firmicutes bacterium]|nr:ABC transporter permease [Dethiobacter sp.]MBS3888307.1 ABC transporter permease [Bacillota bacterium]MBS4054296.1 ABC transporter permease [Thermaerobacter sp.]
MFVSILRAEFKKLTADYRNYFLNYIVGHATLFLLAVGLFSAFAHTTSQAPSSTLAFFFALLFWYYSGDAIGITGQIVSEELMLGTFEQLLLTKGSIKRIFLARLIVQFIFQSMFALVFFSVLVSIFGMWGVFFGLGNRVLALCIVFILTVLGLYGMGFVVAGLSLVFKQAGAVSSVLTYTVLFFTGSIVNVDRIPAVVRPLVYLIPATAGNSLLRADILPAEGLAAVELATNPMFLYLVVLVGLWLFFGNGIFNFCLKSAMRKGNLHSYYF